MIYPGTDLKFKVTTEIPDFFLTEDNFEIVVKDRYKRVVARLSKDDCMYDDDGNYYFTLSKVRSGWYYAFFTAYREDEDYDDQTAAYTDSQPLCFVGYCEKHAPHLHDCDKGHHKVHYEQVWAVSIDGEDYLADCDGRYILTADGDRICFKSKKSQRIEDMGKVRLDTLTGDQFKQLVEGRSMDGKTNTIPEIIDVLQGIDNETTTVKEDVDQQIDTGVEQRKASESDIDEIFNKQS